MDLIVLPTEAAAIQRFRIRPSKSLSSLTAESLQSEGAHTVWPDGNLQIASRRRYSSVCGANGPGTPGSTIGPRELAPNQNKYFSPNWIWRMAEDVAVTTPKF